MIRDLKEETRTKRSLEARADAFSRLKSAYVIYEWPLRGHPDDEVNSEGDKINKGKTKPVKNNGFNPVWNEMFVFESKVPSLAFLEFKVKDHCKSGTDEDIAMFSAPLSLIKEGMLRIKN